MILRGTDAIFDWDDPLPFLMVHHLQIPWLLLRNLRRRPDWIRIDFNIGKLVEPAGTDVTSAAALRVLHLVGSAVERLPRRPVAALRPGLPRRDGRPGALRASTSRTCRPTGGGGSRRPCDADAIAAAAPCAAAEAVAHLAALGLDVVVPQMFCLPGMTHYRALLRRARRPLRRQHAAT